ncbi:hypothetical protein [Mesorhizobium sp. B2-3-12]|uniref:hypothetical protein n=1 Tax=Mesorhizobium sp. B2-3-12 TaxID=2589952 RepID=UPI001FEE7B50|nr:hypothetical protein [Mesorhizobium sp. B2-3-12]
MNFLRHLGTFSTFGKGWTARAAEVRSIGQARATGQVPQAANFVDGGQAKAMVEDAEVAPSTAPADAATGAGIGTGTVAGTLNELQNQISPLSYSSELIGKVVVILAIASALLVIGGLAYRAYVNRRPSTFPLRWVVRCRHEAACWSSYWAPLLAQSASPLSRASSFSGGSANDRDHHLACRSPRRFPLGGRRNPLGGNRPVRLGRCARSLRVHQAQGRRRGPRQDRKGEHRCDPQRH